MKVLVVCCMCNMTSHAQQAGESGNSGNNGGPVVTIELTKMEITDSLLSLRYTIRNASDKEVWVCTEVGRIPFEMFLTHDKQTVLIRKRMEVPSFKEWGRGPHSGKYTRLGPRDAQSESLLIDLPATGQFVYASESAEVITQTVRRLVLEIGYYDEDLPALVRSILEVTDKLGADGWRLYSAHVNPSMWQTYFRGLMVRSHLADFNVMNKDPYNNGYVLIPHSRQALTGEKVLRIEINGIAIPYGGRIESPVRGYWEQ